MPGGDSTWGDGARSGTRDRAIGNELGLMNQQHRLNELL